MSTLEEIYQQITGDDGQKAAFADAAQTEETLAKFLASLGCDATPEEVSAFLKAKAGAEDELADEELDNVSGGCSYPPDPRTCPRCGSTDTTHFGSGNIADNGYLNMVCRDCEYCWRIM